MKNGLKKALSVMLVAVMLLTAAPLNGFAGIELSQIDFDNIFSKKTQAFTVASGTCGENLTWTLKDEGTLTITGTGAMTDYDYETSPFYSNSNIKSVVFGNGVTSIGANAFRDCSQLTTVIMADSITSINSFAFCSCSALDNVVIPPNVTVLKQGAFASCAGLKTITIPASVTTFENSVFRYVELSVINYSGSEDDWNAIENLGRNEGIGAAEIHYNITNPTIASGSCGPSLTWTLDYNGLLTVSGTGGMWEEPRDYSQFTNVYNIKITSVVFSEGITSIGTFQFYKCRSIKTITFPTTLTAIHASAFQYCTGITDIYYVGSEDDWKNVDIQSNNDNITTAKIHFSLSDDELIQNYYDVFYQYFNAIENNFFEDTLIPNEHKWLNGLLLHFATDYVYYAFYDIDKNGIKELIISGDDDEDKSLFDIFTYSNEKIYRFYDDITVGDGTEFGERHRVYIIEKTNTLVTHGAVSGFVSNNRFYKYAEDGKTPVLQGEISYDSGTYYHNGTVVSAEEADNLAVQYVGCYLSEVYYNQVALNWKKINDLDLSKIVFSQPIYMASIWSGIHDKNDSETPESSMLDWLHGKINQNDVAYTPICGIITESLQNNSTYQKALQTWEDVQTIASPSYQIDKYSSLSDIYIGIILTSVMNVLESDSFEEMLNGKLESDTLDWTKTISSIAKELYGIDDYAAYFKDSKTASDFKQKNSDIVVKAYEKRAGKQMNAEFVSETTGFVSEMINIANNASEFLARLTAFMAIAETRDSLKQLLNDLAKNTNIIKNGSIMSNALELVSAATENGLTAAMTAACDMLLHDGVLMISSAIIDKTWSYASEAFPFLKGVQIGAKIGTAICNAFMATEDSIIAYYTAKATYEFYEILQEACGRNESAYLNETTEATSSVYLDAERLYVAMLQLDLANGLEYFDVACNQGLINIVRNWIDGGNANYESIKTSTESIGKSLSDFKTLLEISWIVGHSYLRTDYPEVFESYIKHILTGIPESTPNIYSIRILASGALQIGFTGNIMLNATYPLLDGYEVYVKKNDGEFVLADEIYSYKPRFWSQKIEFSNTDYYTVKLRSFVDTADEGRIYSSFSNEMSILANPAMTPTVEVSPLFEFTPTLRIVNLTDRAGFEAGDLVETVIYRRAEGEETAVEIARLPLLPLRSDVNNQTYTDTTAVSGRKYYYSAQTHIQTAIGTYAGKIYKSELSDEVIVSTKSYGRPSLTVRNSAGGMDLSNTFGTTTINESSVISNCVQMYTKSTVYDSSLSFTNGNEVKDDTGITLSWDRISNCDQIHIYKKYEYADKFVLAAQINGNLTTYTDNAVSDGSTYEYCIAIYQTEDGNSVFCGASDPVEISTPEKARITWVAGDQFIVEYVTVGNSIVIPEFNLGNSEIIGWSSEIPKTVSAGDYTFTAILSNESSLGDINIDGKITSSDARTVLRAAVGLDVLSETQQKAADVDKDGKITSSDARSILRCAVGLETF